MFGFPAPDSWEGLVVRSAWMRRGIGGAYKSNDGRWMMFFYRAPGVRLVKTAHEAALRIRNSMQARGIDLYAVPDPKIGGACVWLQRLGFEETNETIEGLRVWTLRRPQSPPLP